MEERIMRFSPEFRNISNRSVIRFSITDKEDVIDYQFEMLKNNRIAPLLNCEVLVVDQEIRLSYDITSLVTLKKILERKEIGRNDFIQYLNQIINVFNQLENYLLDYGGILIDSDCIYGSPSDDRLYFIYIPDRDMPQNINEPLREFIMHLVIHEMHFKNENADDYIQKLIEALKAPDFSLQTLKSYLDNLSGLKHNVMEIPEFQMNSDTCPTKEPIAKIAIPKPTQPYVPNTRTQPDQVKTEKKMVYPLKSYLILGGDILGMVVLFGAMILKGGFKSDSPDMLINLIGLLLVGGAVTYLVWSKAFTANKKVEKVITKKVFQPSPATNKIERSAAWQDPSKALSGKGEYVNKNIRQPESENFQMGNLQASLQNGGNQQTSDKTVLLSEKNITVPAIKRLGVNQETIMIRHWPFRIGRLAEQVDYCLMNPAMGKLHAELIKKPEGYFINDMNTRNGTFVNGSRVEANSEQPIKDGDKIMLANEEFIFCEQQ